MDNKRRRFMHPDLSADLIEAMALLSELGVTIAFAIASRLNQSAGWSYNLSYADLMRDTGIRQRKKIARALNELESKGVIRRIKRSGLKNKYRWCWRPVPASGTTPVSQPVPPPGTGPVPPVGTTPVPPPGTRNSTNNKKHLHNKCKSSFAVSQYQEIVDKFNQVAARHRLARIRDLTVARKRNINARAKEGMLDHFDDILIEIDNSSFLRGDNGGWRISFDWLIGNDNNWIKVLEGNYRDTRAKSEKPKVDLNSREREVLSLHGKKVAVEFSNIWQNKSPAEAEAWLTERERENGH